jgi:PhzF family phenazine biosynthesis protein
VDVFTDRAFAGNPVAVVLQAEGVDDASMQHIAHWTNLSETTFVLPPTTPDASYRVRIFTPRQELPFAGHPSVGTAHALLGAGLLPAAADALVQECAAGLLPLTVEHVDGARRIFVRSPPARFHPVVNDDLAQLAAALGTSPLSTPAPQVVDNGPHWWLAELADERSVRLLQPDLSRLAALCLQRGAVGVAVFARCHAADHELVVRCFCPADGIPEDPVTGSANACIAAWLARHRALPGDRYRVSQGRELGRDGRLELRVDGADVWVGGGSVTVVDGHITLP